MTWPETDKDNNTQEIIEEILRIQRLPWSNWLGGWARKIRVDELHSKLDEMGYGGDRPPRSWKMFSGEKNLEK